MVVRGIKLSWFKLILVIGAVIYASSLTAQQLPKHAFQVLVVIAFTEVAT